MLDTTILSQTKWPRVEMMRASQSTKAVSARPSLPGEKMPCGKMVEDGFMVILDADGQPKHYMPSDDFSTRWEPIRYAGEIQLCVPKRPACLL